MAGPLAHLVDELGAADDDPLAVLHARSDDKMRGVERFVPTGIGSKRSGSA